MKITLGSLFDGSGGFPLAGALNGICPVWASEIEPYPIAVTRSRFPDMRHLGSVTDIHGWDIEPVDVVTFGSPCQDLSVAGKRAGIHDGERSSLFFEAVRIIREMREATNGKYPTFAVWENVPGAFSSNDGEDFRCVLEELVQVTGGDSIPRPADRKWKRAGEVVGDGYSIAWRTLDAQYWGVPQRRKRIYLVADFAGQRAGKILFELEGVPGDTEPCQAPRESATCGDRGCAELGCGVRYMSFQTSHTNRPCCTHSGGSSGFLFCYDARGNGDGNICPTLTGDHENRITDYTAICIGNVQLHQTGMGEKTGALNCMHDQQCVLQQVEPPRKYVVRRLTPTECARLQGFPDTWGIPDYKLEMTEEESIFWENVRQTYLHVNGKRYTKFKTKDKLIRWYNRLHSDSSEYKMWGNGIALPCASFVMNGIANAFLSPDFYNR